MKTFFRQDEQDLQDQMVGSVRIGSVLMGSALIGFVIIGQD